MGDRYSKKVKLWLMKEKWETGRYRTRGSSVCFVFFYKAACVWDKGV